MGYTIEIPIFICMNKLLMSQLSSNPKKLFFVVNQIFSIKELMGETRDKGIYCPFHGETAEKGSKPSARFYTNNFPVKLWCFMEHKSYYAYHYIKLIMHRDPLQYLIKHSTDKEIEYYMNEFDSNNTDDEEISYKINNFNDIEDIFDTLPSNENYDDWYIV